MVNKMSNCPKCLKDIRMLVKHYMEKIVSEEYVSIAIGSIGVSSTVEY